MLKKSFIVFSIALIILLSAGVISASDSPEHIELSDDAIDSVDDADNIKISSEDLALEDSNDEVIEKGGNVLTPSGHKFMDIQDSINSANENDTIELDGSYCGYAPINVNKALTFKGINSAELNGKYVTSILKNSAKNVIFKNVKFIYGYDEEFIKMNEAYRIGEYGTILNSGGMTFNNCTFIENLPHYYSYDKDNVAFVINNFGEISFNKCSFTDNYNTIYSTGKCNIYSSKFSQSNCIYSTGKLDVEKCKFYNIDIPDMSYIIKVEKKSIIKDCEFKKCTCERSVDPCIIKIEEGDHTISNTVFNDLLYDYSLNIIIIDNDEGTVKISNSKFINNKHSSRYIGYEGHFIIHYGSGKFIIENPVFKNNAQVPEGIIYLEDGTIVIKDNGKTKTYNSKKDDILSRLVFDESFKPYPYYVIEIPKKTVSYNSDDKITVKLYYGYTKKPDRYPYLHIYIKKGNSFKLLTDEGGGENAIVKFNMPKLALGNYKIKITTWYPFSLEFITSVKVTKAKTIVKAPKVTAKKGKSKYFKITLKHKNTKKALAKIKVKAKVYTGKKYKTYTLKTNKKGITYINTKKLKRGYHKVIIQSANKNYIISAKSSIKIK